MKLSNLIWLLPFLSFLTGYYLLYALSGTKEVITPAVVGMHVQPAVVALSQCNLSPRLVKEKEDGDLPNGTVISQTPHAGQTIKEKQAVFLIVSKQPTIQTPDLLNCTQEQLVEKVRAHNLRNKSYYVYSNAPANTCIGQFPTANKHITDKQIITYLSAGNTVPVIVPQLINQPVTAVVEFLTAHNIKTQLFHRNAVPAHHTCQQCTVVDQRPMAGSIGLLTQLNTMHLQVQ